MSSNVKKKNKRLFTYLIKLKFNFDILNKFFSFIPQYSVSITTYRKDKIKTIVISKKTDARLLSLIQYNLAGKSNVVTARSLLSPAPHVPEIYRRMHINILITLFTIYESRHSEANQIKYGIKHTKPIPNATTMLLFLIIPKFKSEMVTSMNSIMRIARSKDSIYIMPALF